MTRSKKLIVLCAALVVVIAAVFGAKLLTRKSETADETSVMNIDAKDITGISWTYDDEDIHIVKEGEEWQLESDSEFDVDEEKADEIAKAIAELSATAVITPEEQTEDYGFSEPKAEAVISTESADTTYTFGNLNDVTNEYYLKITGSDNIFMVPESFMGNFEKTKSDIKAPEPTATPTPTETAQPDEDSSDTADTSDATAQPTE